MHLVKQSLQKGMQVPIGTSIKSFAEFKDKLEPLNMKLLNHPLYNEINTRQQCKFFMENHVWAVWDFMSLVKSLQSKLTCVKVPWTPPKDREIAYFFNQIVLGEESDDMGTHKSEQALSHFELYLKAMKEVGGNPDKISNFVQMIQNGADWKEELMYRQLTDTELPRNTYEFVNHTLGVATEKKVHEVAASFLFGREDPIPKMFQSMLNNFGARDLNVPNFKLYLQRHIDVDTEDHGPMAEKAIKMLCKTEQQYQEAYVAAVEAIEMRIHLWDGINNRIQEFKD